MNRRAAIALLTAITVLGTTLWPLMGTARKAWTGGMQFICHQAGTQVDAASSPRPMPGQPDERREHCPLCILAFFGARNEALSVVAPAFVATHATSLAFRRGAERHAEIVLPQGRAPPQRLA